MGPLQAVSDRRHSHHDDRLLLLSQLSIDYPVWRTSVDAFVLGLGLGMVMQVLVLAAQNSVDFEHLGVATSGTTLFRSLGGALGVAIFGAIFANGLHAHLSALVPPGTAIPSATDPAGLAALSPDLRAAYIAALVAALRPVFLIAAIVAATACAIALLLREMPLRGMAPAAGQSQGIAMPRDATSLEELERIVTCFWLAKTAGVSMPTLQTEPSSISPRLSCGCFAPRRTRAGDAEFAERRSGSPFPGIRSSVGGAL